MKLSDLACKSAKPKDKQYKLFDGGGLYLLVRANGSKLWQLKYRYLKKEKVFSIGQYPATPGGPVALRLQNSCLNQRTAT